MMMGVRQVLLLLTVVSGVAANYGYGNGANNVVAGYGNVDDSSQHHYEAPVPAPSQPFQIAQVPVPAPSPAPVPSPGPVQRAAQHAGDHVRNWGTQAANWFNGNRPQATEQPIPEFATTAPSSQECRWEPPVNSGCKFPFFYKGKYYSECTGADEFAMNWCSLDYTYRQRYVNCNRICGKKNNVGEIIGGVVGGAAAAAGIGVAIAMVVKNANNHTKGKPWFQMGKQKALKSGLGTTGSSAALPLLEAARVAEMAREAAAEVSAPAPPVLPAAPPVLQPRLYGVTDKVAPSTGGAASAASVPVLGFLALLALFTLVAVVGTVRRSKKTARHAAVVAPEVQDAENITEQTSHNDKEPLLLESEAA